MTVFSIPWACQAMQGTLQGHDSFERAGGISIDSREDLKDKIFFAIRGDRFDGHDFVPKAAAGGAIAAVVQRHAALRTMPPGFTLIRVDDTRKALGRLAAAHRRTLQNAKVIAVAGSAGKTTTKRLIDAALRKSLKGTISPKSFNNDIGVPVTILSASATDDYLVVEVGTNALGEVAQLGAIVQPDIAVITMIGHEHLAGLHSLEQIACENAAILNDLRPGGCVIANADAPLLRPLLQSVRTHLFGSAADADLRLTARGSSVHAYQARWWFEVNHSVRMELALPGRHNAINALAAVAVARELGITDDLTSAGLANTEGAPMRMSITRIGTTTIYNDAYNANPESMKAALDTFAELAQHDRRRVLVIGDMLELGDAGPELHRELGRQIVAFDEAVGVDLVVAIGELSAFAAAEMVRRIPHDRVLPVLRLDHDSMQAVADAIHPADAILLKGSRGMALERLVPAIEASFQSGRCDVRKLSSGAKAAGAL